MPQPIPRRADFSNCYVCGPDNPRGLRMTFEREGDLVVSTYTPALDLGGYGTILHGGVTSTLLDEAMAWAVYGLLDRLSLTTEMRVRFLRQLRCGDRLTITGTVTGTDRKGAATRAEIRDSAGVLSADATGTMRFLSIAVAERLARGE
ncbi:MAG: PaaI family thioesterase [Pseudomonadota bacterium]